MSFIYFIFVFQIIAFYQLLDPVFPIYFLADGKQAVTLLNGIEFNLFCCRLCLFLLRVLCFCFWLILFLLLRRDRCVCSRMIFCFIIFIYDIDQFRVICRVLLRFIVCQQSFFFLPVFGINNGLIPIIGYNYGAGKVDRIHRTIKYGVLFAAVFMLTGLALFELAPGLLLSAFNPSAEMLDIGTHALRRIAVHFPIAAFCIVAGSACQALNKSMFSLITSCMRQIFALIPAAYLLSLTGDVNNIWWCFLIAEIVSFVFSFFFLRKAMRDADRRLLA